MSSNAKNIRPAAGHEPLDSIDERLLAALVDDARISNKQLAELVGIAPSTALMRTRALSDRGIIQGFEAKLSLSAIGRSVQALIAVRLRAHDREQIDRFTSRVPKLPAVLSTFHTSGSVDYLLHIAVATTEDLRDCLYVANYLPNGDRLLSLSPSELLAEYTRAAAREPGVHGGLGEAELAVPRAGRAADRARGLRAPDPAAAHPGRRPGARQHDPDLPRGPRDQLQRAAGGIRPWRP